VWPVLRFAGSRQSHHRRGSASGPQALMTARPLRVEHLTDLLSERFRGKRFLQERDPRFEDPVLDDGFLGIPGHVEHSQRSPFLDQPPGQLRCPTASVAQRPKICSAARFQDVIVPVRSCVMRAPSDDAAAAIRGAAWLKAFEDICLVTRYSRREGALGHPDPPAPSADLSLRELCRRRTPPTNQH
jgi:hypothetical protein